MGTAANNPLAGDVWVVMELRLLLTALLFAASSPAAEADEIMARVAENQERAETARSSIVFEREVHTRLTKSSKLHREEKHGFTITPTPDGFESTRTSFEGRLRHKGKLLPYAEPHWYRGAIDADAIVSEILLDLVNNRKSRDGFEEDLFPLTRREQKRYTFQLLGEEQVDGRDTYHIGFEPRRKSANYKRERALWKGEAFVDKKEFQPVYVTTDLARKVPVAVRTLLGTNFKQVGFSLHFREVEKGVWVPVSYGGEFRIKGLFFYNRIATISLVHRDFRRTKVDSSIEFSGP